MKIWLPITPNTKPRQTRGDRYNPRPCVIKYHEYCDELRSIWLHNFSKGNLVMELPIPCKLIFFFEMPSTWSKKKKTQMLGVPHTQTPDIDNLVKGFLDAFFPQNEDHRIFPEIKNDAHIYSIEASKYWGNISGILVQKKEPEKQSEILEIINKTAI